MPDGLHSGKCSSVKGTEIIMKGNIPQSTFQAPNFYGVPFLELRHSEGGYGWRL